LEHRAPIYVFGKVAFAFTFPPIFSSTPPGIEKFPNGGTQKALSLDFFGKG
jgi:hypothetical protein